jgi:hypothetical protein
MTLKGNVIVVELENDEGHIVQHIVTFWKDE